MDSTVLLVIEDRFFLQNLAKSLKKIKALVLTAENKYEALEACANHDVNLALLDIRHHGGDAMQILTRLKKKQPETEVILISNAENISQAMIGMQQGASDDIIVPFDVNVLVNKMRAALKRSKARARARRKGGLLNAFEDAMVAATFAEVGELETARKIYSAAGGSAARAKQEQQHE